jgi:hypothetical protein
MAEAIPQWRGGLFAVDDSAPAWFRNITESFFSLNREKNQAQ